MDKTSWPRCLLWHGWLPVLSGMGIWRVFSLVPRFGRDLGFWGLVGVLCVILMLCMSVIVVMGLPWMTGLGLDSLGLHWPTSPGFA